MTKKTIATLRVSLVRTFEVSAPKAASAIPPDATEAEILKVVHSPSAVLYTTVRMAVAENTRNTIC